MVQKLSLIALLFFCSCAKKVNVEPPKRIEGNDYVIYELAPDKYIILSRHASVKEAVDKACNKVQYVCFQETTGTIVEVERKRK